MDNDDNNYQGQNLHIVDEERTKISSVLRPYALPKFDFDDSLQVHLRFDSLVENEVFLGIPSQEENHWIEDFSRGSSGIEFSSSAAESCSIPRRINVWSEATSSESVEMLLKSVGQEEIVRAESVIEESGICDELGSLEKQMEPNLRQDAKIDDQDSGRALSAVELLKNASGLDQDAGGVDMDVKCASETQEIEHSASELPAVGLMKDGSGVDQSAGGVDVDVKHASETQETEHSVAEFSGANIDNSRVLTKENLQTSVQIDSENEENTDISLNESLKNGTRKVLINSEMQGNTELSSQNITVDDGGLSVSDKFSDKHLKSASNHPEENCEVVEGESLQNTESNANDESLSRSVAHIPVVDSDSQLSIAPKMEAAEERNVETNIAKFEDSSSFPQSEESVLATTEGNNEDLHSVVMGCQNPVVLVMAETMEIKESTDKCEKSLVTSQGEEVETCQGDEVETYAIISSGVGAHGVHTDPEVAEGSLLQTPHGHSSHIKAEEFCNRSHAPFDGVTSETASDTYMSRGDCVVHHQVTASSINRVDDLPSLTRTSFTAEFVAEKHVVEKPTVVGVASGVCENLFPSVQAGMQITVGDISSDRIGVLSHKQDVSGDTRNVDSEAVRLVTDAGSLSSSSLVEEVRADVDPPPGLKLDNTVMSESVSDAAKSDAELVSGGTPDVIRPLSMNDGAFEEVTDSNKEQQLSSHIMSVGVNKQEELKVEIPAETNICSLKESVCVESEPCPVSEGEKGTFDNVAAEVVIKGDQSVTEGEISNTVSQDGGGVADKRASEEESSDKMKVDPVHCGSKLPESGNSGEAATEEHQELKKENSEIETPEASGGGNNAETENIHDSTSRIYTKLSETKKGAPEGPIDSGLKNVALSGSKGEVGAETLSTTVSVGVSGTSMEEKGFTFDVRPVAVPSEGETGIGWQAFPNIKAGKMSMVEKGSASTPSNSQKDNKAVQDTSLAIPRATDSGSLSAGARNTSERKPKRVSGKAGKDSKKGEKEMPVKQPERGDKQSASVSPPGAGQLMQFEVGNTERSAAKSTIVSIPSSNLPDLNTSVPTSALFHQPFTDSQQVQLRAQIFVYGSLIQGAPPDEACMVSAFGTSDGVRNVWELSWRACVERHGHKSIANNYETPVQTRPGSKTQDHSSKQGLTQNKVLSSPASQLSSKGTPFPAVNPIIPISSPLWNISTPSCVGLPSSSVARGAVLDYQALPPLHPYQSPPVRTFGGSTTSWLSQAPFPGPWVAPQSSPFDFSARISSLPTTETVKLTPAKDPSLAISTTAKHVSTTLVAHGGVCSTLSGTSPSVDVKKMIGPPGQHSAEPKSRKRKKNSITEDPIHSPLAVTVTGAVSSPVISSHSSKKGAAIELGPMSLLARNQNESVVAPVISSHFSTSVAVTASPSCVPKSGADKFLVAASPALLSTDHSKRMDMENIVIHAETFSKVEEAKRHADEAAAHATTAVSQCQSVWSQLEKQRNSGLTPGIEEKLASAAVAIAAAASVAKAAAAAAKIASAAAVQAKQMADEASILKGVDDNKSSSSIISAAREAARKRIEAASAASRHAENLDSIVKAAELAAEAVSQAGVVVAMGEPLPLSVLVEAGPDRYWKGPEVPSGHAVKYSSDNGDKINTESFKEVPKQSEGPSDQGMLTTNRGRSPVSRERSRNMVEDNARIGEDSSASVGHVERDLSGKKSHRASDLAKAICSMPETGNGLIQGTQINGASRSNDNGIKEGCLVEVFKDGGHFKGAWYSAKVVSLENGKAFVCYTELQSADGSLREWIPLEGEGNEVPIIRIPHPMSSFSFEGTRKRRRAAVKDYNWSIGDRVDIWVEDCWREGVITEKNKKDQNSFTVHFPAQGETSVVKAWHLRPTLIWKNEEWIELPNSSQNVLSQSDTPQDKRQKLGSPTVEVKGKGRISVSVDIMGSEKDDSKLLPLTASEKVFTMGSNLGGSKPEAPRIMRSGLQKEGSKVIFGVPKPGKKRKFMEVSKHYVSEGTTKNSNANDSAKFSKYLVPQGPGSRGWKNNSKIDTKEKQATESKLKAVKSSKLPSVSSRTLPQKEKSSTSSVATTHETTTKGLMVKDSCSKDANESGSENVIEYGLNSNVEDPTEVATSSHDLPSSATKKASTNAKSERLTKGKVVPAGGKSTKAEVKDKANPESMEPRRSNRRIQPTSRLLEGLQSSLIISKVPSVSHDKSHRSQNRGASRGTNNHG